MRTLASTHSDKHTTPSAPTRCQSHNTSLRSEDAGAEGQDVQQRQKLKKSVSFDDRDTTVHFVPRAKKKDKLWIKELQQQTMADEQRGLERYTVVGMERYFDNYRKAVNTVLSEQASWNKRNCSQQTVDEYIAKAYQQHTLSTQEIAARRAERDAYVAQQCHSKPTKQRRKSHSTEKKSSGHGSFRRMFRNLSLQSEC